MPRYFFHIHDGIEIRDEKGTELADIRAARVEAVRFSGEMLREQPERFWSGERWSLDVTDHRGLVLFSLHFMAFDAPVLMKPEPST